MFHIIYDDIDSIINGGLFVLGCSKAKYNDSQMTLKPTKRWKAMLSLRFEGDIINNKENELLTNSNSNNSVFNSLCNPHMSKLRRAQILFFSSIPVNYQYSTSSSNFVYCVAHLNNFSSK